MANPLTDSQFVRLLDKRLREVAEARFDELETKYSMIPKLFRTIPSDSAFDEFYDIGALPDIPEFTGQLEYLSIAPGFHKKIESKEYAGGVQIQRKLLDDKKYGVLDSMGESLAGAAHRVKEKKGSRIFSNAFTSTFDYMTSEEGVSLCSTAHTTKSGTSTASGFSNSGTSALSKAAVQSTSLLMRRFKNDISERIIIEPDTIIVPDNLSYTAEEIVGTEKGLYTTDGTKNVNYNKYNVIVYPRLDDTDTNNWWMVDFNLMKKALIYLERIKSEISRTTDFETFVLKWAIYFRIAFGWLFWQFLFGHNVS